MFSLGIFLSVMLFTLLIAAWLLSFSARAVGSKRGRFGVGLIAQVAASVVSLCIAGIAAVISPVEPILALLVAVIALVIQLVAIFVVLRLAFMLSVGRTFAVYGVYIVFILVQSGLAIFVLKPFVVEAFISPTKSMSPTVEPGDRFIVNKLLRPKRLDVVAYRNASNSEVYCKRLIGLPGETLRFENGVLFINDQQIELPSVLKGRCRASPTAMPPSQARYRDGESIVLGSDEFFMIGDNADISADSRVWGPSLGSSVLGVVDAVYWPLNRARVIR